MEEFVFKTIPFEHQRDEFGRWAARARGLLWEMGTGKSKAVLDQAARLYEAGELDALLIVAPGGVHLNWVTEEIPAHLVDRLVPQTRCFAYESGKAATKWHQRECEAIVAHRGLAILAISYDGLVTDKGRHTVWEFLKHRKVLYVLDEARRVKNPSAQRTRVVLKSAPFAAYRRLLNGTPVPNGPFDLYTQLKFLDEHFWEPHGISAYAAFKNMFGIFKKGFVRGPGGVMREFPQLVDYKNLDLLQRILSTICSRVTKDQVLDLPPKLYSRRVFELTAEQRKVYEALAEDYIAFVKDDAYVSAPLAITRLLRFQQVTSGFIPVEDGEQPVVDLGTMNPRLDLVRELCEDCPHKAILWCRFNRTVDKIMEMLGPAAVRYDGQVSTDERVEAKEKFQRGDAQFFVAKASTAGEGLTLHAARTVIYVENTFDLAARLQSEDRSHRIGQEYPVNYIDVVALGTVDTHIVSSLRKKLDVASQITGDTLKDWLLSSGK